MINEFLANDAAIATAVIHGPIILLISIMLVGFFVTHLFGKE